MRLEVSFVDVVIFVLEALLVNGIWDDILSYLYFSGGTIGGLLHLFIILFNVGDFLSLFILLPSWFIYGNSGILTSLVLLN